MSQEECYQVLYIVKLRRRVKHARGCTGITDTYVASTYMNETGNLFVESEVTESGDTSLERSEVIADNATPQSGAADAIISATRILRISKLRDQGGRGRACVNG